MPTIRRWLADNVTITQDAYSAISLEIAASPTRQLGGFAKRAASNLIFCRSRRNVVSTAVVSRSQTRAAVRRQRARQKSDEGYFFHESDDEGWVLHSGFSTLVHSQSIYEVASEVVENLVCLANAARGIPGRFELHRGHYFPVCRPGHWWNNGACVRRGAE